MPGYGGRYLATQNPKIASEHVALLALPETVQFQNPQSQHNLESSMFRVKSTIRIVSIFGLLGLTSLLPAQERAPINTDHASLFSDDDVIVVVPHSRRVVSAFSVDTGTWSRIELDTPLAPESNVTVLGKLAVFQTEDCIYAFSSKKAVWDKLPIPKDAVVAVASYNNRIQVQMAGSLFLYSTNCRNWSGTSLATGRDSPVENPGQITHKALTSRVRTNGVE